MLIGVDIGGTATRMALADSSGVVLARIEGPGANPVRLGLARATEVLSGLLSVLASSIPENGVVDAACVGMAGRSHPEVRRMLADAFSRVPPIPRRLLRDDGEIALAAAFGGGPGVLVLAGTGSGACAQGAVRSLRLGGYGPWLSDEGSAAWIALQALRAVILAEDGRAPPTALRGAILKEWSVDTVRGLPAGLTARLGEFHDLARLVSEVARGNDEVAGAILESAGRALAELGIAAAQRISISDPVLATTGSVLAPGSLVREAFERALSPLGRLGPHVDDALKGAIALARLAASQTESSVPAGW